MKIIGILTIVFLFFACQQKIEKTPNKSPHPFIGKWAWEKSDDKNSFSIEIIQKGDSLLGTYCGMIRSGAKMDCGIDNSDYAFGFKSTNEKTVTFGFKSYREDDKGRATLTIDGEKLIWHLIQAPSTEYYAWNDAVLQRADTTSFKTAK